jgi:integrase
MSESSKSETQTEQARVWLTPDQVDSMRDVATNTGPKYLRARNEAIITLLADTGLRNEELTHLTTDMYLREEGELYLPQHLQKQSGNGRDDWPRSHHLELDVDDTLGTQRSLNTFIDNRWKESAYLFPSRQSEQITTRSVRNVVKRLAREAEVRPYCYDESGQFGRGDPADVHPHVFRHSLAYRLLHENDSKSNKFDIYFVRNRLRHASLQTTLRKYDHFRTI